MSLDDLQQVIDQSIANASAFTRGLFEDNHGTRRVNRRSAMRTAA